MITIIHAAHTVYCRNVFYAGYPMEKGEKKHYPTLNFDFGV